MFRWVRFWHGRLPGVVAACVCVVQMMVCIGAAAAAPTFAGGPMPAAPGLGLKHNVDSEPGIAVAPDGTFWAAATTGLDRRRGVGQQILPPPDNPTVVFGNSDIWRSTDGGRSYQWVADPFGPVRGQMGLAGEDTDITVATARNAKGFYNVYAASLWVTPVGIPGPAPTGDIDLAFSQNGGRSWLLDKLAASAPFDDRPWLAADGACTVYLAYHALPTVATTVNRYNLCDLANTAAGATLTPITSTRYETFVPKLATGKPDTYVNASASKIVVDTSASSRFRHRVYIPAMDCGPLSLNEELMRATGNGNVCPQGVEVHVLVSSDRGDHFTLVPIANSSDRTIPVWATWLATDAAGNVYFVWWDTRHVYLDVSTDGGKHWTAPRQIDQAPSLTSIFPTAAASSNRVVEVAWYGTGVSGEPDDTRVMGRPGSPTGAAWRVYWTRSTDGGQTFLQTAATGVVHRGKECFLGSACDSFNGERDLFDDFGLAISPATGLASIAYDDDQPEGGFLHLFTGYATQQP